jgi:hypothetical protein
VLLEKLNEAVGKKPSLKTALSSFPPPMFAIKSFEEHVYPLTVLRKAPQMLCD